MSRTGPRVAVVTGASQGIGAGLVAGYRAQGWAVVANSLDIKPSGDPAVLTVKGTSPNPRRPTVSSLERWSASGASTRW